MPIVAESPIISLQETTNSEHRYTQSIETTEQTWQQTVNAVEHETSQYQDSGGTAQNQEGTQQYATDFQQNIFQTTIGQQKFTTAQEATTVGNSITLPLGSDSSTNRNDEQNIDATDSQPNGCNGA